MDETEKLDAMHNRRQGKDEFSICYFYDKVRLCKELNLFIEAIKRQVAIGLWLKDLQGRKELLVQWQKPKTNTKGIKKKNNKFK